ncbi:MAG: hypothetical protein J7J15_01085 [Candidatus Aenigmarchaeota archaeon]|nr:hypothetical protein [Candidatus Aenigmarchaeota archaeon]
MKKPKNNELIVERITESRIKSKVLHSLLSKRNINNKLSNKEINIIVIYVNKLDRRVTTGNKIVSKNSENENTQIDIK